MENAGARWHPDGTVADRRTAVAALQVDGSAEALEALGLALTDRSPAVRRAALRALADHDALQRPIDLLQGLGGPDPTVRRDIARTLGAPPTDTPPLNRALDALPTDQVLGALYVLFHDENPAARKAAVGAAEAILDRTADPARDAWRATADVIRRLQGTTSYGDFLEWLHDLGRIASKTALPALQQALRRRSVSSSYPGPAATWTLWRIGGPEALDTALDLLLEGHDPWRPSTTVAALQEHGSEHHTDRILAALQAHRDDGAAAWLAGLAPLPGAAPILVDLLRSGETLQYVACEVVEALHRLDPPDADAVLVQSLQHPSHWVSVAAAHALARRGADPAPLLARAEATLRAGLDAHGSQSHPCDDARGILAACPSPTAVELVGVLGRCSSSALTPIVRAWSDDPSDAATDALAALVDSEEAPTKARVEAVFALAARPPWPLRSGDARALATIRQTLELEEYRLPVDERTTASAGPVEDRLWLLRQVGRMAEHLLDAGVDQPDTVAHLAAWVDALKPSVAAQQFLVAAEHQAAPWHTDEHDLADALAGQEAWAVLADWFGGRGA